MTVSEKVLNLKEFITFIGVDRLGKWSHLRYGSSEFSYQKNPEENTCCLLMNVTYGSCIHCPAQSVFTKQVPDEVELNTPDGRKWLISAYPAYDNKGNFDGIFEAGKDITHTIKCDRLHSDDSLSEIEGFTKIKNNGKQGRTSNSESEEKYRDLVERALVGIYSTRLNGEMIIANEALCHMLEYESFEELKAIQNFKYIYKDQADHFKMLESLLKQGKLNDYELPWITRNGHEIIVLVNSVLNSDIISGTVLDITNRINTEQQLRYEKERAEQSDKLKAAFLANISHEIRTPLNGILGFTDILLEKDISKDDKDHYSNLIHNLSGQLLSIVNDILEISRIETNQIKISNSQIHINQILNKLFKSFENAAKLKNLTLKVNSELNESQDTIFGDNFRLIQVLTHLLNNAIKFTYSGSISFGCKMSNGMLRFYVKDTGIGIQAENKEVIFERFRQVEDTHTRKFGGSGLGLPISKALVEMMGGEINVESDSVTGSSFYFTIPYKIVPQKLKILRNHLETKSCLHDCRILICEDDDFGYLLINRFLTQAGASTVRALSGNKAIEYCQSEDEFDLVIMDLRMPEMSGGDAAEFIKKIRPSIPIIVCTAASGEEVESALNKRIFDAVVYKPISNINLLDEICRLV